MYASLKYKYHCNLVHILPAEAFPPAKTAQNPAPKMLPKWEQQTPMLCRAGPLFYWWWKTPKEQKPQIIKTIRSCQLVMWKLKWQQPIIYCGVEVVAGTAPGSVHGCSPLYVSACTTGPPCSQQMATVATATAEWLHTLLLMTNESHIIRKCEHCHAVISNRSLDFNTSHSLHLYTYTGKKSWKDSTPKFGIRSWATLFCPL